MRASQACGGLQQHVVRFVTQDPDPYWDLWVDVQPRDSLASDDAEDAKEEGENAPPRWRPRRPLPGQLSTPPSSLVATLPEALAASAEALALARGVVGQLRLELSVSYLHRTPTLRRVLGTLPPFMAETWLATTYQSFWEVF